MITKDTQLEKVLGFVFKFPHNIRLEWIVSEIYGVTNTNLAYRQEKLDLIKRKGFTWWYCDLDIPNQNKICKMMLERYPELGSLLAEEEKEVPEEGLAEKEVDEFLEAGIKKFYEEHRGPQ